MTQEQETALQIVRTSNRIATPEQLAIVMKTEPRFYSIPPGVRLDWLGQQIITLHYMVHSQKIPSDFDLVIESSLLDQTIMEDEGLRGLTQVEMQEAFRRGISREYGDFYGITAPSLVGFLKGFRTCEKRMKAIALMYSQEEKEQREKDAKFYKELTEHYKANGIPLPDFRSRPLDTVDSEEHRKKIAHQREEILKNTKDAK